MGPRFGDETRQNTFEASAAISLESIDQEFPNLSAGAGISEVNIATDHNALSVGSALSIDSIDQMFPGLSTGAGITFAVSDFIDADPNEDTWLDEANGGTAHGADTTLSHKGDTALLSDTRRAYIAWDLTGIATGTVNSATIQTFTSHSGIVDSSFDWQIYTSPNKPFEEDTATWNNDEPPPGTQRQSGTAGGIAPGGETVTHTLNQSMLDNMLGNWVYLRYIGNGLSTTTIFTTSSKEAASNQPVLNFTMTH